MALSENEIRVDNVRVAFPKFAVPEPFPDGNDPTPYYSGMFIMPADHPQLPTLETMMLNAAIAKWGPSKGPAVLKAARAVGKVFLRDGDTKANQDGFEGMMFISARTKESKPPQIRDAMRNIITKEADIEKLLYGGCYANVIISVYAYTKGNNGIAAGLKTIQFRSPGDAFVGGPPTEDDDLEDQELGVEEDDLTK